MKSYNTQQQEIQKCAICEKPTDKCCSLCKKVFYCNGEHQQVDWHMRHKFNCQGRTDVGQNEQQTKQESNFNTKNDKFFIYGVKSDLKTSQKDQSAKRQEEYQKLQYFLGLLEHRLLIRHKILGQIVKLTERTPQILFQSLVKQTEQLMELSTRITKEQYQPSYSRKITQDQLRQLGGRSHWPDIEESDLNQLTISDVGVAVEYIADNVLMLKVYHLTGMQKEARELIFGLGRLLEQPDQERLFLDINLLNRSKSSFRESSIKNPIAASQQQLLKSIIQMSELYNIDKTTETMYKLFIKKIEYSEGIWQQIYAYFNIGVWYSQKTYYDKAIRAFQYVMQLLDSLKKNMKQSVIFKADCHFNIALCYWAQKEMIPALEQMQEAYRCRVNSIGKNSMQVSNCLMKMAQWYKQLEKWNECLQYLDECHRIRKLFQDQAQHEEALQETKFLVAEVYDLLSSKKKKSQENLDPHSRNYYQSLLQKQKHEERLKANRQMQESEVIPKDSFTSRLFRDDRQFVNFKVVISPEMFETYSSEQLQYLNQITDLTDEKMEKSQAIRILAQNKFVQSLTEEQREQFMKANRID